MSIVKRQDREALTAAAAVFAMLAAIFGVVAVFVAVHADTRKVGAPAGAVQVTLAEFSISPATINVPLHGTLLIANNGSAVHNFNIQGTSVKTSDISPGNSATLKLDSVKAGSYTVYCAIPGHQQAGMQATLVVGGSGSAANSAAGMANMDFNSMSPDQLAAMNDKMDETMKNAVDVYTAQLKNGPNTKGVGNQVLPPKVLADGTKEFDLTAELANWEVSPGKTVHAWTFNGTVPGPWIKVNVGDKVKVVVDNKLPMSTGVHFHGLEVPFPMDGVPDITQAPIKPGQSFTYSFTANKPEMGMYHSHHDAQVQVPNGMLGIFQVGTPQVPAGQGPVTQEVPIVLNDAGVDRPVDQRQVVPGDRTSHRPRRRDWSRSTTTTRVCRSTRCTCTACRSSSSTRTATRCPRRTRSTRSWWRRASGSARSCT